MQTVEVREVGPGGKVRTTSDACGAVFVPVRGATRPVYLYGRKGDKATPQSPMYTCPVSAIPPEIFDLLDTWYACRLLRTLPRAGGFLDQAEIVQRTFPLFESILQREDRARESHAPAAAAAMVLSAAFGKKQG